MVDIESAYLQEPWPADVEPMFVWLPEEIWRALPEELHPVDPVGGRTVDWLWPMLKCQYGHPRSGGLFIRSWLRQMESHGWVANSVDQALLSREGCNGSDELCAAYVDDVICEFSKEDSDMESPWAQLEKRFVFGTPHDVQCYLGMVIRKRVEGDLRIIEIDMTAYASMVVLAFDDKIDGLEWESDTPLSEDIVKPFGDSDENDDFDSRTSKVRKAAAARVCSELTLEDRRQMVGMLLWLARCGRWELMYSVSSIASRMHNWDEDAALALLLTISYLRKHGGFVLKLQFHIEDALSDLKLFVDTDANLSSNRSQSAGFVYMYSKRGSFIPLEFSSKRQTFLADSTPWSEFVAAHSSTKMGLNVATILGDMFLDQREGQSHLGYSDTWNVYSEHPDTLIGLPSDSVDKEDSALTTMVGDGCLILRADSSSSLDVFRSGHSTKLGSIRLAVKLRTNFMADCIRHKLISVGYVRSALNRADIGTKPLKRIEFERARKMLNIVPVREKDVDASFSDFNVSKAYHLFGPPDETDIHLNTSLISSSYESTKYFDIHQVQVCKATYTFPDNNAEVISQDGHVTTESLEVHEAEEIVGGA